MTFRRVRHSLALFALLGLLVAGGLRAGDTGFQGNSGASFFSTDSPCPLRDFPTLESINPVPQIVDPFEQDIIPVFCQIQVNRRGQPLNKAKGTFSSTLFIIDNNTGMFESVELGSGKFATNSDGIDQLDFEIPAAIFADGFESGDVSVWSYTGADFTKKKKADEASLQCGSSGSK